MDFGHVPPDRDNVSRKNVVNFGRSGRAAYLRESLDFLDCQ